MIRDKVYIPISKYKKLNSESRKLIKSKLSKDIVNPYLCYMVAVGKYCNKVYNPETGKLNKGICYKCPNSKKKIKCYKVTKKYFIFSKGDHSLVNELLNVFKIKNIKDKSVYNILEDEFKLKFNYKKAKSDTRFKNQLKLVKDYLDLGYGQIKAPPRSGKTIVGALLSCKLNTKTAIIIHQKELLEQFYTTFINFTNIEKLSKLHRKRLIAINPEPHEINDVIIALFTWQQFKSKKGKEKLREYRKLFGLVISDESHRCSSNLYSYIIESFWAKYRCGLSATPKRKDNLHIRSYLILGPPIIEGGSEQLECNFYTVNTGWFKEYKNMNSRTWQYLWDNLAKNKERNDLISRIIVKAVKSGHKVIVPVKRIIHADNILSLIPKKYKKIKFVSGISNREEETLKIKKGYYDVVVATKGLISEGFDCPFMSLLILNAGSYHNDVNSLYQEYSRVRTVCKNKKKPGLVILNDDSTLSNNSTNKIIKELKLKKFKDKGYINV